MRTVNDNPRNLPYYERRRLARTAPANQPTTLFYPVVAPATHAKGTVVGAVIAAVAIDLLLASVVAVGLVAVAGWWFLRSLDGAGLC